MLVKHKRRRTCLLLTTVRLTDYLGLLIRPGLTIRGIIAIAVIARLLRSGWEGGLPIVVAVVAIRSRRRDGRIAALIGVLRVTRIGTASTLTGVLRGVRVCTAGTLNAFLSSGQFRQLRGSNHSCLGYSQGECWRNRRCNICHWRRYNRRVGDLFHFRGFCQVIVQSCQFVTVKIGDCTCFSDNSNDQKSFD